MKFQAILFDLDGTLADTIGDISAALNYALEKLGQPTFSAAQCRRMVGNGMKILCRRALAPDKQALAEPLLALYHDRYLEYCREETALYPGVREMLDRLAAAKLPLAVITNKPQDQARRVMDYLLPGAPLAAVWGQQAPFGVKPDPAVYRHVAGLLGVDPARTLYCGDSDVDIQFAHNAGAAGLGCLWGFRGRAELEAAGADLLAENPLQLAELALGQEPA